MEVLPGIHLLKGILGSNVYLLEDGDGLVLVDAGMAPWSGGLRRYVESLGRDVAQVSTVLLTHSHPDHTAGLRGLRRSTSARVLVHPGDVREDSKGGLRRHYPGQLLARDWPLPFLQRLHPDGLVHEGEVLPVAGGMEVIHTLGHTPGSVVLYQRDRGLLFTGDSLLSNGKVFRRPLPFPGTDFKAYRRSVERIAQLDFEVALVGHGRPMLKGGRAGVEEMLQGYSRAFAWGRVLGALRLGRGRKRPRSR